MLPKNGAFRKPGTVQILVYTSKTVKHVTPYLGPSAPKGHKRRTNSPSFQGLSPVSSSGSQTKRRNRATDTRHERLLRSRLWKRGLRFRKNVRSLPGKPDVVFPRYRVAVFCDGDFWHGRDWRRLARKLRTGGNGSYWVVKIETNRLRDRRNERALRHDGWLVVRLWETDILQDPEAGANAVEAALRARKRA